MTDTPNAGKVRAEALRIAENGKPPTSHATYPTKAILEGESRRRAVFQYAEGITRGRTVTAEQVEAAAESLDPAPWDEPFLVDIQRFFDEQGSPVEKRKAQARVNARAVLRAAGFYVEGDDE